ncbi:PREDICTED: U3 small nucleolar RNA-associated protein 14 homolog A-like, partial [Bison bison bison]|uniref:U3 small nucleolar RNA-associated protein 14 homolog A-like n=1 Tax=Bison bison bison TaxID=43346 RepID=A0A6P3GNS1_BISBB
FPSPHQSDGSSFFCFQGDKDEERKHQKLLESISSLNGKDRQKLADRSEASLKVSEFSVSSEGSGEKLVLSDLLEPVKTSSSLAAVKKQLNRVKSEKRIKSKKYHRILKKGKAKQALKDFEKLQKVNPAAALEELEKLDKARMMERMSLKHQNSGKWAKSKAIMAKYDLEVRHRQSERRYGIKGKKGKAVHKDASRSRVGGKKAMWMNGKPGISLLPADPSSQEVLSDLRALCQKLSTENHQSGKQELSSARTAQREEPAREEEEPMLLQRPKRARTLDELEELGREGCVENEELPRTAVEGLQLEKNLSNHIGAPKEKKRKEQMIDLQNLLTTKSPSVKSLAVPTTVQELEDEEERDQRQIIKEAFAGDDVIRDFLKEKREAVEASKPKDLDLTLPGWGEWGGIGLKPSAKKRRRFLIKAPEGPPRKDKNLPNVIINEKRNTHAAAHQVQVLPHPFTHHQQFERTIQTPVGSPPLCSEWYRPGSAPPRPRPLPLGPPDGAGHAGDGQRAVVAPSCRARDRPRHPSAALVIPIGSVKSLPSALHTRPSASTLGFLQHSLPASAHPSPPKPAEAPARLPR